MGYLGTGRKPDCHPTRKHKAHGYCGSCYVRWLTDKYTGDKKANYIQMKRMASRISRLSKTARRPYADVKVEVEALFNRADSCEVCGTKENLHIDHCHKTGRIRGLLCHFHNAALGFVQDDQDTLHNCIRYLMRKEREQQYDVSI